MDIISKKKEIEAKLNSLGYDLVSISNKKEMGSKMVSIVVDKVEPIDMNMIVSLSNELNPFIDSLDNSDDGESYILDISSLGAEKPIQIEKIKDYKNRYVHVHLINPIKGENIFEGTIEDVKEDNFTLSYRVKTRVYKIDIYFYNIYKIRLAIKF